MTTTDVTTDGPGPLQPAITARPSGSALVSIAGRQAMVALRFLLAMTVVLGIAYPLLVLGIGQLATSDSVNGSLVTDGSRSLGRSDAATQKISSPQFVVAHAGHRPGGAGRAPLFPQMKDAGI